MYINIMWYKLLNVTIHKRDKERNMEKKVKKGLIAGLTTVEG